MSKKLQIRVYPDGTVESKTVNIKGKKCEKFIGIMEKLTKATVINSEFTPEYYEEDIISETTAVMEENING